MKSARIFLLLLSLAVTAGVNASVVSVNEPKVCYDCHSDVEESLKKNSVHTAFKTGKCSACHNPHASRHAGLITENITELCLTCHTDIKNETHKAVAHQPARDGDCVACHDPHASDIKNQLKQETLPLCSQCHSAVAGWMTRPHIHQPVKAENCNACHTPHGSENGGLLDKAVPALCFTCHKQDAAFGAAHKGYDLAKANCVTCHDPHSSGRPNLIMANQHSPFRAGQCNACHAAGGSSAFALVSEPKALCLKCHKDIQENFSTAYHNHLTDDNSCLNCHNPHAAPAASLLAAEQKDLCFRCHFIGEKYKKDHNAYLTHDGMECSNCHTPHGAGNPRYLKTTDVELCLGCHAGAHRGSHPVGKDVIDPRNNEPMTCISCHQLHGPDFKLYLPLNPAMDLCIQCHKR